MLFGKSVGFVYHFIFLCLATGYLIVRYDQKIYDMAEMQKEKKVARFLGLFNIWIGALVFLSNWAYHQFFAR